jgi:enamine deaminase RidA (YjgF/YER057c/UK114 family)
MAERVIKPVDGLGPMFEGWLSPAIRVGDLVFLSGLIGCDPKTGKILDGTEAQVRRIFEAMDLALKAHDTGLQNVVRMTMYFTDRPRQWPVLDKIRREIWTQDPPATTGVGISELEQGAEVELEAIAVVTNGAT